MTRVAAAPGSVEDTASPVSGSGRLKAGSLNEPTSTSLDSVRTITRVVGGRVGVVGEQGDGSLRARFRGVERGAAAGDQREMTCTQAAIDVRGSGRRVEPGNRRAQLANEREKPLRRGRGSETPTNPHRN